MFLPISSTPQPERRKTPQRRHSIEKETPTNVRQFQPPTKQNSKSLVSQTSFDILYIPSGWNVPLESTKRSQKVSTKREPQILPSNLTEKTKRWRNGQCGREGRHQFPYRDVDEELNTHCHRSYFFMCLPGFLPFFKSPNPQRFCSTHTCTFSRSGWADS